MSSTNNVYNKNFNNQSGISVDNVITKTIYVSSSLVPSNFTTDVSFNNNVNVGQTLTVSGNMGVGKPTPAYPVDVSGIINATALYVNGAPYIGSQWTTLSSNIYYNTGNVAIGKSTNPSFTLDVSGIVNAGSLYVNGSPYIGSQWTTGTGNIYYSGNVGVGKTTPSYPLDISGIVNAGALYVNGAPYIGSQWTTGTGNIYYNSGNVGIGTSTPSCALDVKGTMRFSSPSFNSSVNGLSIFDISATGFTSYPSLGVGNYNSIVKTNDSGIIYQQNGLVNPSSGFVIAPWMSATSGIRLDGSGNVGIGTTTPSYTLDVNGSARFNSLNLSNLPMFCAHSSSQAGTSGLGMTIIYPTVEYNIGSCYSSSTGKFTPTVAGYYQIHCGINITQNEGTLTAILSKNSGGTGVGYRNFASVNSYINGSIYQGSSVMYFNGTTDYAYIYITASGTAYNMSGDTSNFFQAFYIRSG